MSQTNNYSLTNYQPYKLALKQEFTATGLIGPDATYIVSTANHLSIVTENVGVTNAIQIKGRIIGQTAFTTITTITGTASGTDVDVSLYDQVQFNCSVYSASGGVATLIVSSFFKVVSDPSIFVTSVGGTAPIVSSGGTTPVISLTPASVSAIAASDIDWALLGKTGGLYTKDLAANTTFTFSNMVAGYTIVVRLTNDGNNWTVTWPTVKWAGGVAPTMTTGAKSDVYSFIFDGTDVFGSAVQDIF